MNDANVTLTVDEVHALMGLVMDKRRTLIGPGKERAAAFYADLDTKLHRANVGLMTERFADLAADERASERLWRKFLKAVALGDRLSELTLARRLFLANFRRPT